jgi:zinc transport system substrate-binding protein
LAEAYGLHYYAAFPGCTHDTEPSAADIAFLIDKTRELGLPVVFHGELSDGHIARTIAGEAGAAVALLHSCHTVSLAELEGGVSYLSLMRQNLEALRDALQ